MATSELREPRTYGNWKLPASVGIWGLGTAGTAGLFGGIIVAILVAAFAGFFAAIAVGFVELLVFLAMTHKDSHGRNVFVRQGTRMMFSRSRRQGTNVYRSGPLGRTKWGTHQLPGLAAALRLSEISDTYNRRYGMLYCPRTSTYTVVFAGEPEGGSLVDADTLDARVANFGGWLASLGDEPGVKAASVTIETAPDSGARLRREVEGRIDPEAPAFARAVVQEAVDTYPVGASTLRAYITVTFSAVSPVDGKKRGPEEMATDLATRLPSVIDGLASTGAGAVRSVSANELCRVVFTAYHPDRAAEIEEGLARGETLDLDWTDVGPSAHQANWDGYRHDRAYSVTWQMSEAPRGHVTDGVLNRLLAPHHAIARKRVTLLYRPIPAARAAGIVEADVNKARFNVTASPRPTARDQLGLSHASQTAMEEAAGAGLVNFAMVVTATVVDPTPQTVGLARATVDALGLNARMRLRTVYGAQDSAFASALPLGLIIPDHLKVPSEWRERL